MLPPALLNPTSTLATTDDALPTHALPQVCALWAGPPAGTLARAQAARVVPASVRAGGYCDGDENENENDGAESTKTKKRRSGGVADVGGAPLSAHTPLSAV